MMLLLELLVRRVVEVFFCTCHGLVKGCFTTSIDLVYAFEAKLQAVLYVVDLLRNLIGFFYGWSVIICLWFNFSILGLRRLLRSIMLIGWNIYRLLFSRFCIFIADLLFKKAIASHGLNFCFHLPGFSYYVNAKYILAFGLHRLC